MSDFSFLSLTSLFYMLNCFDVSLDGSWSIEANTLCWFLTCTHTHTHGESVFVRVHVMISGYQIKLNQINFIHPLGTSFAEKAPEQKQTEYSRCPFTDHSLKFTSSIINTLKTLNRLKTGYV